MGMDVFHGNYGVSRFNCLRQLRQTKGSGVRTGVWTESCHGRGIGTSD